ASGVSRKPFVSRRSRGKTPPMTYAERRIKTAYTATRLCVGRWRRVFGRSPLDASVFEILRRGILLQRIGVLEHGARLRVRVLDRSGVLLFELARAALHALLVGRFLIDRVVAHSAALFSQ